jgi:nitronate monooxygenase
VRTTFTELLGVAHPIALAPMGGLAGGSLAAAVSNGGGLGLVGGGREDLQWLERELAIVAAGTANPWGVGFQSWSTGPDVVERALRYRPAAVMLSFGDPRSLAEPVLASGTRLIVQVTDLDEAQQAVEVGADVIVAQGNEAGGHGGGRATLPFVPIVVDLAGPIPVLAAGGIADGRGVAAALALGSAGALVGTRFQATPEALVDPEVAKAIIDGRGDNTERSRVLDIARALHGQRATRPVRCATPSSTAGAVGKTSSKPTRTPRPPIASRPDAAASRWCRYGPAKPSTSSPISSPPPSWSGVWRPRRRRHWCWLGERSVCDLSSGM